MRYRRPFTPQQRRNAARVYDLMRSNYRSLKKSFPPVNSGERAMLKAYEQYVHAIGSELLKVDALVNVDELNDLIGLANAAMVDYFRLRHFGR